MSDVVGIDVGGTFTDLFYSRDGIHADRICKVPSTPQDPSIGLLDALTTAKIPQADLSLILHGTTIATNALIERVGAKCALVTTRGFRDVLELGRRDRPDFYGLTGKQNPLIPRNLRYEIDERMTFKGAVVRPVDRAGVERIADRLEAEEVDAIVVSFLHSYANPAHEERGRRPPRAHATRTGRSSPRASIIREYYEFERTSTAAIQAFLQPLIKTLCREAPRPARRLGLLAPDPRHAVERRPGAGGPARPARRPHRPLRPGRRRHRRGAHRRGGRLRPRDHRRHGRHQLRRRGGDRRRAGRSRRRPTSTSACRSASADDRRPHHRRRRRLASPTSTAAAS